MPLKKRPGEPTSTQVFGNKIAGLAGDDKDIVVITAAMPEGTGLDKFRSLFPQRFFDVGIAEAHAVCFSAGLAKKGLKPVVAIYSTFLQRAYDQIMEAVALQELGVVFVIDRAGIVGEDGPTHQGVFDIVYLRSIPNLVVMAPKDGEELEAMLEFAVQSGKPVSIRYPKDKIPAGSRQPAASKIELGRSELLKEGNDFALIALGSMVMPALEAVGSLEKEGLSGFLINARFVKPLDSRLLEEVAKKVKYIFTVEDGIKEGGLGSAVVELLNREVVRLGVPDEFVPCGKRGILLDKYGLTAGGIAEKIKSVIRKKIQYTYGENNHR